MPPRLRFFQPSTFILLSSLVSCSCADIYSATFKMERLLDTRQTVINNLEVYIQKEENRLEDLKKYLRLYKSEQEASKKDKLNYVGNPINAFTLIKRLTTDLDYIEKIIKENKNVPEFVLRNMVPTSNETVILYPTSKDLQGAAAALSRLQKAYKVKVKDLTRGVVNGIIYIQPMTASDCYEMGVFAYKRKDYKSMLAFHMAAYRKLKLEDGVPNIVDEIALMEDIALAHYHLSEPMAAAEWTAKVLTLKPEHRQARKNYMTYHRRAYRLLKKSENDTLIRKQETATKLFGLGSVTVDLPDDELQVAKQHFVPYRRLKTMHKSLCRGEYDVAPEISSRLTCRYLNNKPFLKLAPIKMEQLYIDPDIYQFYDIISDEEIEHVKNISRPLFRRAAVAVLDPNSTTTIYKASEVEYRISQSAWLYDEDSEVIARWTQRVSDFTGLDTNYAEDFQIANYGIGGHYDTHYDFAGISDPDNQATDRIATSILYLSDVAQGGATVFPTLGLSVFPVKGSALFWMNLHPSGEGNQNTIHAGCPVLEGSKWIANKWISLMGQEFLRPCNLIYQHEQEFYQKPQPVPKPDIFMKKHSD